MDEAKHRRALGAFAREHSKALARVQSCVEPLLGVLATAEIAMRPIYEFQKNLKSTLVPILAEQRRTKELIAVAFPPSEAFEALVQMQAEYAKILQVVQQSYAPAIESFRQLYFELPPKTQKALLVLGQHGWYLDLNLPLDSLWEVAHRFEDGEVQEANLALMKYYDNRLEEIEEFVLARVPGRASVLHQAFTAHRRGEFALSVPVLIAQADGICAEITRESPFRRTNGRPRTATYVDQIAENAFRAALLAPLAMILPLVENENERGRKFAGLNRHMVLHGESVDYGTRLNGLKAVSLLNYVVGVLCKVEENP